jgi:hypothetical protein
MQIVSPISNTLFSVTAYLLSKMQKGHVFLALKFASGTLVVISTASADQEIITRFFIEEHIQ